MELFRLLGTIAINNTDANKAIEDTTGKAGSAEGKLSNAFGKIGGAAVAVGKTMMVGLAAGATAVGAIGKSALDAYADFEQLKGGVETLFGAGGKSLEEYAESVGKSVDDASKEYQKLIGAQNTVLKNADEAYKNAGMSANEYIETVTGFSASLIQSLDGDTAKAAEKADQAINDMSDNANKMGSDITSIQNAYQGFAKQNYTMLDNLKLGYGGTQEEMARLIKDAAQMTDVQKELGITVDASSMSFGNIVDAISVVQKSMGIMGATADEAERTISGSISSMKSAWANLIAGLGNEDADLSGLIDNFVNSASKVVDNVAPRIEIIFGGISDAITKLVPKLNEKLPDLLKSLLPALITGAVGLVNGLIMSLPAIIQVLIEQIPFIVSEIGTVIIDCLQNLGIQISGESTFIQDAFSAIANGLGAVWQSVGKPVFDTIVAGMQWLSANWDDISASISVAFQVLWDYCKTYWQNIGKPIWDMISSAVSMLTKEFSKYMPQIKKYFQDAVGGMQDTWNNHLKPIFEAIGKVLNNVVKPAFEFVFKTIVLPTITNTFKMIGQLWTGTLKPVFDGICDFLTGVFTGDWETAFNGILSIVTGIYNGIITVTTTQMNAMKDAVRNAIDYIKEKFNFEWKLPDIKLPHFKVNGEFSVNPPSVPKFGVEWYKKGAVLNAATMFGINALTGKAMVGGEAGAEAVAPIDVLQGYVAEAVAGQNAELLAVLSKILKAIETMDDGLLDKLITALVEGVKFKVDNREIGRMVRSYVG